ncbi:MAG: hypothetical protein BGP13_02525 [Sphingobacteriales bacterium 40-81]|nr:MAG: hypothetical protein BGP13_02525 [Sphingobacteriales bacterium 40-81]
MNHSSAYITKHSIMHCIVVVKRYIFVWSNSLNQIFNNRNMKQQNEVNSKAGTLKMKTSMINLYGKISKAASMLLIAVTGFGMMSFTQDDTSVNSVDTNLNINNETVVATTAIAASDACCGVAVAKPGDEIKSAFYISLPNAKAFVKADREAANRFYSEVNARRSWSMDMTDATKKADAEMNFNFKVSSMNLAPVAGFNADAAMVNSFTEDVVLKSLTITASAQSADNEMIDNFIAEHFSIKHVKPSALLIAKADAEIVNAFEKANLPFISVPSQIAANNADLEVIHRYQVDIKNAQTVATK